MHYLNEEIKDKAKDNASLGKGKRSESCENKSQINAEYFQALEQWLNDVRSCKYSWYVFVGFPYTMMAQQMCPSIVTPSARNFTPVPTRTEDEAVEYRIPPLWKRFIAETIDFILLIVLKLAIGFIVVDFINLEKYESLQQTDKLDIKFFLELTSDLKFLEVAHKLIVCLYEGIFLRRGMHNEAGGATPGKAFMGIRVILCNSIEEVENQPNVVKVIPAKDLGVGWSFARALIKNLVLSLLLPVCFPFFFNKFNRTAYDVLCHSVVVEDRIQPNRNE